MTTPDYESDVFRLRRKIGDVSQSPMYTDEELEVLIDAASEVSDTMYLDIAALGIWYEKMATYASLTDIVESGSERKLSQLFKNAQGQVAVYQARVGDLVNPAIQLTAARVVGKSSKVWGQDEVNRVLYGSLGARA